MGYRQKQLYLKCLNNIVNILCFIAIFIAIVALSIFYSDASNLIDKVKQNNEYVTPKKTLNKFLHEINSIQPKPYNASTNNPAVVVNVTNETSKYNKPINKNENDGHVTKEKITPPFNEGTTKKTITPPVVASTERNENSKTPLKNVPSSTAKIRPIKCKMLPERDDEAKCGSRIADRKCCEYKWAMNYKDDILQHLNCGKPRLSFIDYNAASAEFPHMAAVGWMLKDPNSKDDQNIEKKYKFKCSGSLISSKFVLTSAHCLYTNNIRMEPHIVRLGTVNIDEGDDYNIQDIEIEKSIHHPEYSSTHPYHDIALLKLKSKVSFSKKIHPACISTTLGTARFTKVNVTGWKIKDTKEISGYVQQSTVNMIKYQECRTKLKDHETWRDLQRHQLCAVRDGRNVWQGDPGSPMQIRIDTKSGFMHSVIGVTSMSHLNRSDDVPSVYISVSSVLSWIEQTVWPEGGKDESTS